ncbi:SDR family oxidoreductase [Kiritimatiellota bacterium B12222]|nr:SDR family oxidoreductase [Kiritimatiellota bacterium B12222]
MKSPELENKVAVVTGAGGVLCSALSKDLARQGMKVALLGRTLSRLEELQQEIEAEGGIALALSVDVTDSVAVQEAADKILTQWGPCKILLNGAGGKLPGTVTSHPKFQPEELLSGSDTIGFLNADLNIFRKEVDLNLVGTAIPSQIFGRQLAQNGGGVILNFASMTSYRPLSKIAPYSASKAAIINFTQWLSVYLAPAGIRVNAIAPGFFVNERSRKLLYKEDGSLSPRGAEVLQHTPAGRFGEAEELIGTMNWLIHERSAGFVTGITVPVDGGFLACAGV